MPAVKNNANHRKRLVWLSIQMVLYVCAMVAMFWLIGLVMHKNSPELLLLEGVIVAVPFGWRATFGRNKMAEIWGRKSSDETKFGRDKFVRRSD